jgi:hypothetical protein
MADTWVISEAHRLCGTIASEPSISQEDRQDFERHILNTAGFLNAVDQQIVIYRRRGQVIEKARLEAELEAVATRDRYGPLIRNIGLGIATPEEAIEFRRICMSEPVRAVVVAQNHAWMQGSSDQVEWANRLQRARHEAAVEAARETISASLQ